MTWFLIFLVIGLVIALFIAHIVRVDARAVVSEVVRGTRVLVCVLNQEGHADPEKDAEIYAAFYRHVDVLRCVESGG